MTIRALVCAVCFFVLSCGGTTTGRDGADTGVVDADDGAVVDAADISPEDQQADGADPAGEENFTDAGEETPAAGDDGGEVEDSPDGADGGADAGDDYQPLPIGCVQGEFLPFWGNLHSHSTLSDGEGSPEEAFTHARDVAHLDIMVLTDHMEQLLWPLDDWEKCHQIADAFYQPGVYLTDCGFEYATALFGLTGHNNVFFSPELFSLSADFEEFYRQLAACHECIGAFNHPGDSAGHTWKDFQYDEAADVNLNLIEFNTDADPWAFYFQALDAGWHVSPTYNQDNHGRDWGSKNDRRSGYFLSALTREALHDAMQDRRSFMTFDKNAWIKMMAHGHCWMGSILSRLDHLDLEITAADTDGGEGFTSIELYGPGASLIYAYDCRGANPCSFQYTLAVTQATYVTARATQADGDYLVGASIWAQP